MNKQYLEVKEIPNWLIIVEILLHIGKNPSKVRCLWTSVAGSVGYSPRKILQSLH